MFVHIVFFTPKPGLEASQRRSFAQSFRTAAKSIASVRRASIGHSTTTAASYGSQPGLTAFEYAAVVEFDDAHGLTDYLGHEAHRDLGRMFWELCEETAIVDCELRDASEDLEDLLA